jgi:hypothetical protein
MMDDNRQAGALRRQLDEELADVRATAAARERLLRNLDAVRSDRGRARPGGWRPQAILIPIAAVAAVVALIAAPAVLRAERTGPHRRSVSIVPAQRPGLPTTRAAPVPEPSTARPEDSPPTAPKAMPTSTLKLRAEPATVVVGHAVTVVAVPGSTKTAALLKAGRMIVTWGDGSTKTDLEATCATSTSAVAKRKAAVEASMQAGQTKTGSEATHIYKRPGTFTITVTMSVCADPLEGRLVVHVQPVQPSPTRSQ